MAHAVAHLLAPRRNSMRVAFFLVAAVLLATPALAAANIQCSQIPDAQAFIDKLKPGPNTKAAQAHLDAAKAAKSDQDCVTELGKVNYYAKRSAAADARANGKAAPAAKPAAATKAVAPNATQSNVAKAKPAAVVQCADPLHQDRPGGSDYRGPPVPGCKPVP
jgi:hypothetical protein